MTLFAGIDVLDAKWHIYGVFDDDKSLWCIQGDVGPCNEPIDDSVECVYDAIGASGL